MTPMARTPRRHLSLVPPEDAVYVLRITLEGVEPPVWRRLQVAGSVTLERLHAIIQKTMGWRDVHLHEFEVDGKRYGQPEPDEPHYKVEPEWKLTLRAAASAEGARFRYVYDLGDGWGHEVVVELGDESFRLRKSLETASKIGARFALIVGENEIKSGSFALKNLASGEQILVPRAELAKSIQADSRS